MISSHAHSTTLPPLRKLRMKLTAKEYLKIIPFATFPFPAILEVILNHRLFIFEVDNLITMQYKHATLLLFIVIIGTGILTLAVFERRSALELEQEAAFDREIYAESLRDQEIANDQANQIQNEINQISTGTLASGERWESTNTLMRDGWNFSFLYPSNLQADDACSDGGYCFSTIASPEDKFYFGYARMGNETGEPITDIYAHLRTIELTQGAEYDRVLVGTYEGLREVTADMERIYVRMGVSDVWYFYVQPATPPNRVIFERIISTMKIEVKVE